MAYTTEPLNDFLLARIAEDEAKVSHPPESDNTPHDMRIGWGEVGAISEVLLIGEARLRAECEAKRRIVDRCGLYEDLHPLFVRATLRDLAIPYTEHPDYRDEWRSG